MAFHYKKVKIMSINKKSLSAIITSILLLILVIFNLKQFSLWPQVTNLWESGFELKDVFQNPHGLRYLLVYPFFIIAEYTNIDYDVIFSFSSIILFYIILKLNLNLLSYFSIENNISILLVSLLYLLLALEMNGRMLFSIIGSSFIIYTSLSNKQSILFYPLLFLSITLSSVSSGTFILSILWVFTYLIFAHEKNKNEVVFLLTLGFIISFISIPYIILLVLKNINYFGGGITGIYNMLHHGIGKIIPIDPIIIFFIFIYFLISILLSTAIYFIFIRRKINSRNFKILFLFLLLGCVIGVFGASTFLYSTPIFILIIAYVVTKCLKIKY